MKDLSHNRFFVGMLILMSGLIFSPNLSLSSSKFHLQDKNVQQDVKKVANKNIELDSLNAPACDKKKPYFTNLSPYHKQVNVLTSTKIKFTVRDDLQDPDKDKSGVDTSTVYISIRSKNYNVYKIRPRFLRCRDEFYVVDYEFRPTKYFERGDTVRVTLEATDLSYNNNTGKRYYWFVIEGDINKPELLPIYPQPEQVNVPVDSFITIQGTDIGTGVDTSDVTFKINGSEITVFPSGDPWDFTITYKPESNWQYNDSINVFCSVHDLEGNTDILEYWFKTELPPPPQFYDLSPFPNETEIALDKIISFKVCGGCEGVDSETIKINGKPATKIEALPDGCYYCEYDSTDDFNWNDIKSIKLEASDLCNPTQSGDTSYVFYVVKDTIKPNFSNIDPGKGGGEVAPDVEFRFTVLDAQSHVNKESVTISIKSTSIDTENVKVDSVIFHKTDSVRFYYKPDKNFEPDDQVDITLKASDWAGNPNDTTLHFYISPFVNDTIPPEFIDLDPDSATENVNRNSAIYFTVVDTGAGVDENSVKISIWSKQLDSLLVESGIPTKIKEVGKDTIRFMYKRDDFNWNDTITVKLEALDLAKPANTDLIEYSFSIVTDTTAPVLTAVYPIPEAINVAVGSAIKISGSDENGSGVPFDNLLFQINGIAVAPDTSDEGWNPHNFSFSYLPEGDWKYGSDINVSCTATDVAGNVNILKYSFKIEHDTSPPTFSNLMPDSTATNVARNAGISFTVLDNYSGVNKDSVKIFIKSRNMAWTEFEPILKKEINPDSCKMNFSFQPQPSDTFDWTDNVKIKLYACDLATPPNCCDTLKYEFYTERDTMAPVVEPSYPEDGAQDVPCDAGIILHVTDKGRGCDTSNFEIINFEVFNEPVDIDSINFDATPWDFYIYYSRPPESPWEHGKTAKVCCTVQDKDNNVSKTLCVCFTPACDPDLRCPWFTDLVPQNDDKDVSRGTNIQFSVIDDSAGVDKSSIKIDIGKGWEIPGSITPIQEGFRCIYNPDSLFDWNDSVSVKLYACDKSDPQKCCDTSYVFYIEIDTTAPVAKMLVPEQITDVDNSTEIVLLMTDDLSGVKASTIEFKVNGDTFGKDKYKLNHTDSKDTIRFTPEYPFELDSEVTISLAVSDSAGNRDTTTFKFQIESDTAPPIVFEHDPPRFSSIDTFKYKISFKIADIQSGINKESISVTVSDTSIFKYDHHLEITEVGTDSFFVVCPELTFSWNDSIHVKIYAQDNKGNETDTSIVNSLVNYYFKLPVDTTAPVARMIEPEQRKNRPVSQPIKIEVIDGLSGVDTSSLRIDVKGDKGYQCQDSTDFEIQSIDPSVIIVHKPKIEYSENEKIEIFVTGKDSVNNWFEFEDSLTTEGSLVDNTPPIVFENDPALFSIIDTFQYEINFKVTDNNQSGVNEESIKVEISTDSINYKEINYEPESIGIDTFLVICDQQEFNYNDTVYVKIYAADKTGNHTDTAWEKYSTVYYYFTVPIDTTITKLDTIPPYVTEHVPDTLSISETIGFEIKFKVVDENSAVDKSKIKIEVSVNKEDDYKIIDRELVVISLDTIQVNCEFQQFNYNDSILVRIYAADKAGNHTDISWTEFSDVYYYIKTPIDLTPPTAVLIEPTKSDNVPPNQQIIIDVSDLESGINPESFTFSVTGDSGYSSTVFGDPVRHDKFNYTITHTPENNYAYSESIRVVLKVEDLVGNADSLDTTFQIIDTDVIPPVVFDHKPPIKGESEETTAVISFKLKDDLSGVNKDLTEVFYKINDKVFQQLNIVEQPGTDEVSVTCSSVSFNYNDTVWVKILAVDSSGNKTDTTDTNTTTNYYFTALEDITPPQIVSDRNIQLEDDLAPIFIEIQDLQSGVEIDSLKMVFIWGQASIDTIDVKQFIDDINNINNVKINYVPSKPYPPNEMLKIRLYMVDKVNNSKDDSLTVGTITKKPDLTFQNVQSSNENKQVEVNESVNIYAHIINKGIDCEESFEVVFYYKDIEFGRGKIDGLAEGAVESVSSTFTVPSSGEHVIEIKIDPDLAIPEENENNNDTTIAVIGKGAQLSVRPNLFTPNGDNVNDETEFDFTEFQISNPILKIFDIHGKKMIELTSNTKKIRWSGRDENGHTLLPGIYLYVLLDSNKAVTRGCIAIAR